MYGEETYPWGFIFTASWGLLQRSQQDENTWHLTAYCDVTNAYGATARNRICDAYVTEPLPMYKSLALLSARFLRNRRNRLLSQLL